MPGIGALGNMPAWFAPTAAAGAASANTLSPSAIAGIMGNNIGAGHGASTAASPGGSLAAILAPDKGMGGHHKGGGGSFWGDALHLGQDALNVVNTPFDALQTGLSDAGIGANNALHALTGISKHVNYLPGSDFIASWKGRSPGSDLLGHIGVGPGVLRTYGGLALDLGTAIGASFIDPLGLTKIVGEASKAGEAATAASRGAADVNRAAKVAAFGADTGRVTDIGSHALPAAERMGPKTAGEAMKAIQKAVPKAYKPNINTASRLAKAFSAENPASASWTHLLSTRVRSVKGLDSAVQGEQRAAHFAKGLGASAQGNSEVVKGLLGKRLVPHGDLTGARRAAEVAKFAGSNPEMGRFIAEAPKAEPVAQRITRIAKEAAATPEISRMGDGKLSPDAWRMGEVKAGPNTVDNMMGTTEGRIMSQGSPEQRDMLRGYNQALIDKKAPGNLGFRLGRAANKGNVGKLGKLYKEFDLGVKYPQQTLNYLKGGAVTDRVFKTSAAQKIARKLHIMSDNAEAHIAHMVDAMGKEFNISPTDRFLLGMHSHAGMISKNLALDMKAEFQRMGVWTENMDKVQASFQKAYEAISHANGYQSLDAYTEDLLKQLQHIPEHLADGTLNPEYQKQEMRLYELSRLGPYAPSQLRASVREAMMQTAKERGRKGGALIDMTALRNSDPRLAKGFQSAFHAMTPEMFASQVAEHPNLPGDFASKMQGMIEHAGSLEPTRGETGALKDIANPESSVFRKEAVPLGDTGHMYEPTLDSFALHTGRMQAEARIGLDRELRYLVDSLQLPNDATKADRAHILKRLSSETNMAAVPGTLAATPFARHFREVTRYLKMFMTTNNPGHYVKVAMQDWVNTWVTGNPRHFLSGPVMPWSKSNRFAKGTLDNMYSKVYTLGKNADGTVRQYTGAELSYAAHMVGLGFMHGYAGEDIQAVGDMLGVGKGKGTGSAEVFAKGGSHNPATWYARKMKEANINRDNAQRIRTFMLHMKAGDHPLEAGMKTIRVNFDYGAMSDVEKNIIRHVILFYSWFRKNAELHIGGLATRPALYAAMNTVERDRPKQPGEPGYYKGLGLLAIPGLPQFGFGNPMTDALSRLSLDPASLRENTLGNITPLLRVPAENLLNKNFATGGNIQNTPGLNSPSVLGQILQGLGLPGSTMTSKYSGGLPQPATDPFLNNIVNSVLPPTAPGVNSDLGPGGAGGLSVLGRLLGIRPYTADPRSNIARLNNAAWAAQSNAKSLLKHGQLP